mmetsp:Transcript_5468/g.15758  ORF Transcript_5468/g.15758 Transcript_5468/m.15758 type:complete len:201 (-) Transcript_5468:183-785(-)
MVLCNTSLSAPDLGLLCASHGCAKTSRALSRAAGSTVSRAWTKLLASLETSAHSSASKEYLACTMRSRTSVPKKGEFPESRTKSRQPNAQRSIFSSHVSDVKDSGAVYKKVPTWAFILAPRRTLQPKPKSMSLTRTSPSPASTSMMFSGLMSRCTTPRAWQYDKADATCRSTCAASCSPKLPNAMIRSNSSPPWMCSMTI